MTDHFTMRDRRRREASLDVDLLCDGLLMSRIDACTIAAEVVQRQPTRDRPVDDLKHRAMSNYIAAVNANASVTVDRLGAPPDPTISSEHRHGTRNCNCLGFHPLGGWFAGGAVDAAGRCHDPSAIR